MSAARDRLRTGYYNNRELAAGTNPGGMARNGHRVNFILALKDVGDVGQELSDSNDATVLAVANSNAATVLAVQGIADAAAGSASAANTSKVNAGTSETNAGNSATTATNAATDAKRTVANNFPDRLDATGSWFTEATTGDPGAVAVPTAAAISNVVGYGYEYTKANAQGQLLTKGVLAAAAGKFYEVEAEVEWTVKGGAETPSLTVGVQGLDAAFANAGGQVQAPLQAVGAIGVVTMKYRFGYAAPTGGAAWPVPGTSVWLRPYVLFNRKSDNSGPVTASTARVRRLTVRDVTAVVAAEVAAAAAAASAATVTQATDAEAIAGTGVGLMNGTRVGMAIAAQAMGVGAVLETAADPGSRWLRTNGSLYLNASYPALRAVLGPYQNPIVSRLATSSQSPRIYYLNGLWIAFAYVSSNWGLYSSPDLVTWTARTMPAAGAPGVALSYGAGLYVWADGTSIKTSPDLVTWTARTFPSGFQTIATVVRGATKFVAPGSKTGGSPGVAYSSDGITWTVSASTIANGVYCAAYNATGARWIMGGSGGKIYRSTDDGVTWADAGVTLAGNLYYAAAGGGYFAICSGNNATSYISADGLTWTVAPAAYTTPATSLQASYISFDGGAFVISHYSSGLLARSADFVTWTFQTATGMTGDIVAVLRSGGTVNDAYVIAVPNGVFSGLDLSTTQFQVPTIAAGASNTLCYIKAS